MFWDASALVPVVIHETRSSEMVALLARDPAPAIWWGSPLECASAIHRRWREKTIVAEQRVASLERLRAMLPALRIVPAVDAVRERAARLLPDYPLRAADALQLAAALTWCEEDPASQGFVCLDQRLGECAERAGFRVLGEPL